MLKLPVSLERRLTQIFPKARDRERFIVDVIEEALASHAPEHEDMPQMIGGTLHLFTDGGSRGNPGQAAIGCVLVDPARGVTLEEYGEAIGVETNNVAEYKALIAGLKIALRYQPNRLLCQMDSELIVKQLSGEYKVRMPTLQPFVDEIRELTLQFPDVVFRHIPRADNWRADALVNKALDAKGVPKFMGR